MRKEREKRKPNIPQKVIDIDIDDVQRDSERVAENN